MEEKVNNKSRKVFISFLGTTDYFSSMYYRGKKFCSKSEKYVQVAALQYLQRRGSWTKDDIAYILLTKAAKERNWEDGNYTDRNGKPNVGLKTIFKTMGFPFPCKAVNDIPEGKNENEIWQIFKIIHDLIQEGDELYFDITYGYRYLPMLVVVLSNYSKFLEKAKVKCILYGNYEGRDKDADGIYIEPARSPIVDLLTFSTLQDWTYAVADFINNGNTERISNLTRDVSAPQIKKGNERAEFMHRMVMSIKSFSKDMQTCRGQSIVDGTHIKEMKDNLKKVQEILGKEENEASVDQLLIPVFGQIQEIADKYNSERDINNGFKAVGWCLQHQLFQQAITILQETVKSYFCLKLGYETRNIDKRLIVEFLLDKAKYRSAEMLPLEIQQPKGATEWSREMKKIATDYDILRDLRNDFNHSGFNNRPAAPLDIEETIKVKYDSIINLLGIYPSAESTNL